MNVVDNRLDPKGRLYKYTRKQDSQSNRRLTLLHLNKSKIEKYRYIIFEKQ